MTAPGGSLTATSVQNRAAAPAAGQTGSAARPVRRGAAVGRAGIFAWVPVCLACGIGLWFILPRLPAPAETVALMLVAMVLVVGAATAHPLAYRGLLSWRVAGRGRLACLAVSLIICGLLLAGARSAHVAAPVLGWRYYGPIEGRLVGIDRSARDRIRLTLDQVVLEDIPPRRLPHRVRLSLVESFPELPMIGQRIHTSGHLGPPSGPAAPGSFDFARHAWFEGLGAVGYTRNPVAAIAPPEGGAWRMHRARMAISDAIQRNIEGQSGAVAAALMTGDRSGITEATNEMMRASNLYHIISISGLHMSMLTGFVYAAVRMCLVLLQALGAPLPQAVHKLAALVALGAATGYLWLSGGGVATERAFVMVAVMLGAILFDRRAISLRTVALAATIILVLTPEALTSPGFQMSFAATVALILCYGPWSRLSPHLPPLIRPVVMLLISSLVAGLATSPIAAAHFNRMAHYGIVANLLAVPAMGMVVMPAGVIAVLLAPLGLAAPALWAMGIGTDWMLRVADFVQGLGGSVSAVTQPPPAVLPMLGLGAVMALLCWRGQEAARPPRAVTAGLIAGIAMMTVSACLWLTTKRPDILIAPEGEAVGLMTGAGRALSRPRGGAYVVRTWLAEDGDLASQQQAAGRLAWQGEPRDRHARLRDGWEIWHLTGSGAGPRARAACSAKRIIVTSATLPSLPAPPPCLAFDLKRLRGTGAVAIDMTDDGPRITTPGSAMRPWN